MSATPITTFSTTVFGSAQNFGPNLAERLTPSIARFSQLATVIGQNLGCHAIGVVTAFDPARATVEVQLATKELIQQNTGDPNDPASPVGISAIHASVPILTDVPVILLGSGGWTVTFPIATGDECLVLFSDTEIDSWFQSGGVNNITRSQRRHSLSDGIALFGLRNQTRNLANYSTTDTQIRNDAGTVVIGLNQNDITVTSARDVNVTAARDVTINSSRNLTAAASNDATITAAQTITISATAASVTINAGTDLDLNVTGNLHASVNGAASIIANGNATLQGANVDIAAATAVTISGATTLQGKAWLAHEHVGVQTGTGISGPVA